MTDHKWNFSLEKYSRILFDRISRRNVSNEEYIRKNNNNNWIIGNDKISIKKHKIKNT